MMEKLKTLQSQYPAMVEVRGKGLMIGVEFQEGKGAQVQQQLLQAHYLTGCVAGKTLGIYRRLLFQNRISMRLSIRYNRF